MRPHLSRNIRCMYLLLFSIYTVARSIEILFFAAFNLGSVFCLFFKHFKLVKPRFFKSTIAVAVVLLIFLVGCSLIKFPLGISQPPNAIIAPSLEKTIGYEQRTLPQSIVHVLRVPVDSRESNCSRNIAENKPC